MGQIQAIEIKETAEERRNGQSKSADKKRNVKDGFMGVFCRNSDPTANPPRAELLRRKNPDGNEMKKVGFGDNRHMVTYEGQLTVGIDGGNDCDGRTRSFPLGRHLNLASERSRSDIAGQESLDAKKQKLGHGAWRQATVQYIGDFLGPDVVSKKCPVITQQLFLKHWRAMSSLSRYF
jgi:hypothetical protein